MRRVEGYGGRQVVVRSLGCDEEAGIGVLCLAVMIGMRDDGMEVDDRDSRKDRYLLGATALRL